MGEEWKKTKLGCQWHARTWTRAASLRLCLVLFGLMDERSAEVLSPGLRAKSTALVLALSFEYCDSIISINNKYNQKWTPISAGPCRQQGERVREEGNKRWRKRWMKQTSRKSKKLEARRSNQVARRKPVAKARNFSKQDTEAQKKEGGKSRKQVARARTRS